MSLVKGQFETCLTWHGVDTEESLFEFWREKMAMRKPLSVRNSEDPGHRKPNAGKGKKARPHYLVLDRPTIVSQLNIVLKDSVGGIGPAKISEEDLKDPTVSRQDKLRFKRSGVYLCVHRLSVPRPYISEYCSIHLELPWILLPR